MMQKLLQPVKTELIKRTARGSLALSSLLIALVMALMLIEVRVLADEGHGDEKKATATAQPAVSVRTAERNVQTPAGQFTVKMQQAPSDPRAGEEVQFAANFSERIEGGFSGGEPPPVTNANVSARITTAAGQPIADKLPTHVEGQGAYGVHYTFRSAGEYKLIFDLRTSDNRQLSVDFPVSIAGAPVNWAFWLGLAILTLLSVATIIGYYSSWGRDGVTGRARLRKTIPVAVGALAFFAVGTIALAYFAPPRERRKTPDLQAINVDAKAPGAATAIGDPALGGSGARVTISKESQLLFNIRTAPVTEQQITSGLKVTGAVRVRPDARAVVAPPVSGRVFLKRGLTIGTAVGRGEQIGSIEQILGASEQAELESQRTGLRTAALEQQSRQAEQVALAQQARTRLAQAQRELRRATNLLEVGAAPRKRVEEAQTAVRIAEQEVAAAEQQAGLATQQARLARESVARVNPVRNFPLLSPVTGMISEMKAVTGQQVEAGVELMNVINLTTVFLEAQVFEKDLSVVRDSRRASYTAAGIPGEVYRIGEGGDGRLVTIGQSVNPESRTVPVIFEVPNPLNRLRDGMFVEITIDTTGSTSVLSVPKQAVVTEQGRTFVYVFLGGEIFEKRVVVIGSEGQESYEVKSGLKAGERVVVEGIYQLRSTQPGT
ncbi:MAG: efflux RND transporter periplasmic adaptor subunit [Acidobacteria bacterium]|nr:efflux RND transporter periplasmic adaptor subunit [Acidobacteriota bacterium]